MEDDSIGLVANFFEVNAKYGIDESLRRGLFNGLLEFTAQYLRDNREMISGFYINPLTYGWNQEDLVNSGYSTISATTPEGKRFIQDKLGGPFIPSDMEIDLGDRTNVTVQLYYLASLGPDVTSFYVFNEKVLSQSNSGDPASSLGKQRVSRVFHATVNDDTKRLETEKHQDSELDPKS